MMLIMKQRRRKRSSRRETRGAVLNKKSVWTPVTYKKRVDTRLTRSQTYITNDFIRRSDWTPLQSTPDYTTEEDTMLIHCVFVMITQWKVHSKAF